MTTDELTMTNRAINHLRSDPSYRCATCNKVLQFSFDARDNKLLLPAWCPECTPEKESQLNAAYDEHQDELQKIDRETIRRAYIDCYSLAALHLRGLTSFHSKALLESEPELVRRTKLSTRELQTIYRNIEP